MALVNISAICRFVEICGSDNLAVICFSNKVIVKLYVFCAFMVDKVGNNLDDTSTVST